MNRTWPIVTPLLILGLAGVVFLVLRNYRPLIHESTASLQGVETNASFAGEGDTIPEPQAAETQTVAATDSPLPGAPPVIRYSANELMEVLPLWMREEADVDTHADDIVIAGTRVNRVRGRYAWPNGSMMEVEISDLGEAPSDLLLRSLGYNTALIDTETAAGFSMHVDVTNQPGTFEYDYETGEGGLLVLVADRFLVEVQLGLLPPESFDAVIEHQVPLNMLEEMAARERAAEETSLQE